MGGSALFIFPDCGKISKALLDLCSENNIQEFMFVVPDKHVKPRHIISFMGVFDEKKGKTIITVRTEKKKR